MFQEKRVGSMSHEIHTATLLAIYQLMSQTRPIRLINRRRSIPVDLFQHEHVKLGRINYFKI